MRLIAFATLLAVIAIAGCSKSPGRATSRAKPPSCLSDLLKDNHGRVLVLLLGVDGCPGTAKATEALDDYLSSKPKGVSVVRLDVPPPGETIELASDWKHQFPRYPDNGRKIASELDFFYYPTLYVFDGDGTTRYVGGCDIGRLAAMTSEILAEKPGAKKYYTLPMPAVGEQAPELAGTTLAGKAVTRGSLTKKRGLLIVFSRTSCPYSLKAIPQAQALADSFRDKGVGVVIVNQRQELVKIKPIYDRESSGLPVIWDRDGSVSKAYGVDAVPFFFLTDGRGKVIARRSFTDKAASDAINSMLGLEAGKPRFKPTEGG